MNVLRALVIPMKQPASHMASTFVSDLKCRRSYITHRTLCNRVKLSSSGHDIVILFLQHYPRDPPYYTLTTLLHRNTIVYTAQSPYYYLLGTEGRKIVAIIVATYQKRAKV